jgi:uncharacterized protein (DUF2267 family)
MSIFSWIGKAFQSIGAWFAKAFKNIQTDAAPVAVAIVEELQTLLKSGVATFLENVLDTMLKSGVPTAIANAISAALPKILADLLAIEGLPTSPTDVQLTAFSQAVLAAWGINDNTSKVYTTLGAQIIGIIRANTAPGQKFTFAVLVADLEQSYQDWQADIAANAPSTPDPQS